MRRPPLAASAAVSLAVASMLGCGPAKSVVSGPPPKVVAPRPVRILDTRALLMGGADDACTHETPPSGDGDRWCAFTLGEAIDGLAELWVIDVTRAARGTVPPCDGTSNACLRLTRTAALHSATFFEGDTLIYHSDPISGPNQEFLGPIFAWRPGWSRGRQISSGRGLTCIGNKHSAAAACIDEPGGDPAKYDSAAVSAGLLADENAGALPSFGRWPLRNDNDQAWKADFSPDGSMFALSSAARIGEPETLWATPTARVGTVAPTRVMDDASSWQISNDGKKVYFRRRDVDLYVTDFPGGGVAQPLEQGIRDFGLVGDRPADQAAWIEKDLGADHGAFELVRDRGGAPPKTLFTFSDILDGHPVSTDLRYTTWLDYAFRGIVLRNDDLTPCALDVEGEPAVYDPVYLRGAALMFWQQEDHTSTNARDGYYASPAHCRDKTLFARDVALVAPIGDRGLVFTDGMTTGHLALAYAAVSPDGAGLDAPTKIQDDVATRIVFVGEEPPLLVYPAVGATPETSGIFVYGPVPF